MRVEYRQALAASTLRRLNEATGRLDLVRELLLIFKKYTEFEAVGIRLRDGDDYPYYTTDGFSDRFVEAEMVGLLQLNDRRRSRITREDVDFLESMGSSIFCFGEWC